MFVGGEIMKNHSVIVFLLIFLFITTFITAFSEIIVKEKDFTKAPLIKVKFGSQEKINTFMSVYEDGERVTVNKFEATNKNQLKPIDLVFVIDTSGSMDDDIEKLRNSVEKILTILTNLDYRVAVTGFGDPGNFKIYKNNGSVFVNNSNEVEQMLKQLIYDDFGGYESQIEALYEATKLPYRNKSLKLLILITDEDTTQVSINNTLYDDLISKVESDEISIVCLLGSCDDNPAIKDEKYPELSERSGAFTLDLASYDIEESMKKLAYSLVDEYYIEYYTNYKYFDGKTTKVRIGNHKMSIQFPKNEVKVEIGSNLRTKIYIDNKYVGRTNNKYYFYESFLPVAFTIGDDEDVIPKSFNSRVKNMYRYIDLAPLELRFSSYVSRLGAHLSGFLSGIIVSYFTFEYFQEDSLISLGGFGVGYLAGYLWHYFKFIRPEIIKRKEVKKAVDHYNYLVEKYYEGKCSYSELIDYFEKLEYKFHKYYEEIRW